MKIEHTEIRARRTVTHRNATHVHDAYARLVRQKYRWLRDGGVSPWTARNVIATMAWLGALPSSHNTYTEQAEAQP